jgi:hypothetical protein
MTNPNLLAALPPYIDYSQYDSYKACPMLWWEKYINQYRRSYADHQRDDAIAIGSVVHSALENYYKNFLPEPSQEILDEMGLTPEAATLCRDLIAGYVRVFNNEPWQLVNTEEPIKRKLTTTNGFDFTLLAKVDAYFKVDSFTTIPNGPEDTIIALEPGYYIQEYKTASQGRRDLYLQRWEVNKQADFQLLALEGHLGEAPKGIVVNVLEKPKNKVPTRKCKSCKGTYEYAAYFAEAEGFKCPMCGFLQKLTPLGDTANYQPTYYRFLVQRNDRQLIEAIDEIGHTRKQMEEAPIYRNTRECVGPYYVCDYFTPHTYGIETSKADGFVKVEGLKYVGLKEGDPE